MIKFKFAPEEFVVEEVAQNGVVLERGKTYSIEQFQDICLGGKTVEKLQELSQEHRGQWFSWFVMEKREWNTSQAMGAIASKLGIAKQRLDCAGNKDRNAITVQLCSAFAIAPERLLGVKVKDVKINGAWLASKKVRLGELQGNRFMITLNEANCGKIPNVDSIEKKARSRDLFFPNFFGSQRFGSLRSNTAQVGEFLLKGDAEGALMNYLCFVDEENEAETEKETGATEARKKLLDSRDFQGALREFPRHLKFEREMIAHLAKNPNDFAGALRLLPRHVLLLFVHAFQSKLFNELLERKLREGVLPSGELSGKIIGFDSELDLEEQRLLESHGLSLHSFKIRSFPELSCKGDVRPLFVKMNGFEIASRDPLVLKFELPAGSYATVALDYLLS